MDAGDPLQVAARRLGQARLARAMIEQLSALLEGLTTRERVEAWAGERWPEGSGQGTPFVGNPNAHVVFASLLNVAEREGEHEIVRLADLRAYLDWLTRGEVFSCATREPLIGLSLGIDELAERTCTSAVRCWVDGLGWRAELRFCAAASGRPFHASGPIHQPGVEIHERRGDLWRDAVIDLFETLAIDERDVAWLREDVELGLLPEWSFWREDDNANRFEIERFRSYAKAEAQVELFRARGHKQFYWVEPSR
ncbi:hypothetical protein ACNOYE_21935 [Nannocystaceae bacterium ST9]